MAGEGGFGGGFGGFDVAGFPYQQHVRVLAHEGPQGGAEVETLVAVHLGLGDAPQGVFDRVFHRGDVDARVVALREQGIEGGGFARAGGPCHQNHPEGFGPQGPQGGAGAAVGDQGVQAQLGGAAIKQPQAHLFAVAAGQGADPEVHGAAAVVAPNPAVLGKAPLGDVQVGHDFEAGGDGRHQGLGQVLELLMQHPIDSEADFQARFLGLHVDVAGAGLKGCHQDPVHHAHHRGGMGSPGGHLQIVGFLMGCQRPIGYG